MARCDAPRRPHAALTAGPCGSVQDDLTNIHANTHIPEIVGSARGFEVTGNTSLQAIALK